MTHPRMSGESVLAFRQRGVALVAVLWIVAALTLLVASMQTTSTAEIRVAQSRTEIARAAALGDAAIQMALLDWRTSAPPPDRMTRKVYTFEGVAIELAVVPASGYINLNAAPEALLRLALEQRAGLSPAQAQVLAQRIIDWRDQDDAPLPQGAEAEAYVAAGVAFRPRNKPFTVPEDLMQVLGMELDLFDMIQGLFSVWSGSAQGVNPMAAPYEVLLLLAGGRAEVAAQIATARDAGAVGIDTTALEQSFVGGGSIGNTLHLIASVPLAGGGVAVRGRWVNLAADVDGAPWRTLSVEPVRFVDASKVGS